MKNKQLERLFLEDREEHQLKDKTIIALNIIVSLITTLSIIYIVWLLKLVGVM